ncbi:hypothetical protein EDB83DRAFT_2523461 [Lactarius deliciosus]|nr:hypothetical protein EDB83DRAFT_2523461 [Lactarius deliciosus]
MENAKETAEGPFDDDNTFYDVFLDSVGTNDELHVLQVSHTDIEGEDKAYHFKLTQILSLDPASRLIQLVTLDAITTALSDPTIIDFDLLERSRRSRGTDRMTDPYQLCKLLDATLNKRSRNLYSQMLSKLR